MPLDQSILGKGVYTPREAARLVGTSPQQILRWTRGSGPNEPLWDAHYQFLDDDVTEISFLDLVEVRVVAAMRKAGVSLQSIRFAISFAQKKLRIERPLASHTFKRDGSELLIDAAAADGALVSLSKKYAGQSVFSDIISQSLSDLEYEDQLAARWRPAGFSSIIIDPSRHFGDPILDEFGISSGMIFSEYRNFGNISYLASIYEIPVEAIKACVDFEESLEKANGQSAA